MKKVLFATTALVLSAGFAAAEVSVSGDGRMGFVYDGNDMQFASRARVKFTLTGESDAGLSFGGSFRVDHENAGGGLASSGTAGSVYVSGTYGKLSMGDVVSAAEAINGDLYEIGYTLGAFGNDIEEINYITGDGVNLDQGANVLYEYSINGFNIAASMSDGSTNVCTGAVAGGGSMVDTDGDGVLESVSCFDGEDSDAAYSVAVGYDLNGYKLGLGYSDNGTVSEIVLSGEATFNEFTVKGIYQDLSDAVDSDGVTAVEWERTYGLAAKYDMSNGVGIQGFWRRDEYTLTDIASGADLDEEYDSFGIGASYDLGGGATLAGGIIDSDYNDDTVADMGIRFTF
ncbi:porin [Paracoccus sp. M683]|uniref:porin n=1 Tax=Paracoccus sp. M683 TaxID=2594268 RepID=UPI00117D0AE5|nr:porin [Paracoccus sp. M683]TRW98610.1 porin [Paracoccus sp. M683]